MLGRFANVGCPRSAAHRHDVDIFDLTYLILHNNCGRGGPKPRVLLFDMGASVGFKGVEGGIYATMPANAGGRTPSLPLFYKMYEDRCLEPDEVFAWEPKPGCSAREWWGEVPAAVRAKVRYYEDVVEEGELSQAAGDGPHPARSFLAILEANVREEDFVAVGAGNE